MTDKKTAPPEAPKIEARENGPRMVRSMTRRRGADGQEVNCKPVMALCRCALSANKPFCDGAHRGLGWKSEDGSEGQEFRSPLLQPSRAGPMLAPADPRRPR